MKKRNLNSNIVVIDCSALIYAAYYTTGHLNYNGQPTGIIYGFLSRLLMLSQRFRTTDLVFCFDSGSTHRTTYYPEYKQGRLAKRKEYTPEEVAGYESLINQSVQLNKEILPRLGFKNNFMCPMYEADDLIGHWINRLSRSTASQRLILVTADADMFQCLDKCVIYEPRKKKPFNKKQMIKKFGTPPKRWALAKAIGGCEGDGVKGVEGVSDPKNATSRVHKYLAGEIKKGVIYDRIESDKGKKIINRNLPIVTLPYKEEIMPRMIRRRSNKLTRRKFLKEFDRWQFVSFLKKENFRKWESAFNLRRKRWK